MKVWTVHKNYDYEGFHIDCVVESEEKAIQRVKEIMSEDRWTRLCDDADFEEHDVT